MKMKIAISSTGKSLESEVDVRFGRCNYFLIVESEEDKIKDFKVIENTAKAQMGGAGITSAQIIANEKPDVVITVNTGPKAFEVLNQLKIKICRGEGKVKDVVQRFLENKLEEISDERGLGHHQRGC
jgi:predicted Fe-Mo cluster-binding NifX family protein